MVSPLLLSKDVIRMKIAGKPIEKVGLQYF